MWRKRTLFTDDGNRIGTATMEKSTEVSGYLSE